MTLTDLKDRLTNVKQNYKGFIIYILNNQYVRDWIINTIQERLFEKGQTASGKDLNTNNSARGNVYATQTIIYKGQKGQPFNRVTLKDTGKFYNSFKVSVSKNELKIKISANFIKSNNDIYDNFSFSFTKDNFTKEILNLSEKERITLYQNIIKKQLIEKFNSVIYGR